MRIAVMILGLLLAVWTFVEGFVIAALSSDGSHESSLAGGALIAAMLAALAAALVIAFPLASTVLFSIAGAISLGIAAAGYGNHWVYGSVFMILAVMSFFGWRGKRAAQRQAAIESQRQHERDQRLEALLMERR